MQNQVLTFGLPSKNRAFRPEPEPFFYGRKSINVLYENQKSLCIFTL
jgi:hypothetical protein